MPHAETHAVILPHAVVYNKPGAKDAIAVVARAWGTKNVAGALFDMSKDLGEPCSLKELGLRRRIFRRLRRLRQKLLIRILSSWRRRRFCSFCRIRRLGIGRVEK